jgi:hypothetical protein
MDSCIPARWKGYSAIIPLGSIQENNSRSRVSSSLFCLHIVLVDQPDLENLIALLDHDPPRIASLAIDFRKAPDLVRGPPGVSHDVALDVRLAGRAALLLLALQPAVLLVGVLDGVSADEARPALQLAEDVVFVLALLPVQRAQLRGALQSAGCGLLDVDVHHPIGIRVLLDAQVDGGQADSRAGQPADALERKDWVGIVGESLVLQGGEVVGMLF